MHQMNKQQLLYLYLYLYIPDFVPAFSNAENGGFNLVL